MQALGGSNGSKPLVRYAWATVHATVEPLEVLRQTLAVWGTGPQQEPKVIADLASDLSLLLDPDLWCDDFRPPKHPRAELDCCPPPAPFHEVSYGVLL